MCDWANEGRCFPSMVPIKCHISGGCNRFVYHLCTIQWAVANNVDEGGIATLCKEHQPEYQCFSEQRSTINSKTNWKTGSGNCPSSSNACCKDEEYLSRKDNDYNELNQVRSKSKKDDLKKRTSDNKSGGTFDNNENCGLNVEFDKVKITFIDVKDISRVHGNTSHNMRVEENDAMLDFFKRDILLKCVSENLKENTKKSAIIDIYVSRPFCNQKTVLMHWSVIHGSLGAAWMIKSSFMGGYVRSVLTSLNF